MATKTVKKEQTKSALAKLLAEEDKFRIPKVGEIVEGKVISVSKTEVHLDIEGITTGVIRGAELFDESGEYSDLKLGDLAQATVLELENENGEMELSFRHAGHKKAWDELNKLMEKETTVDAKVIEANKGGLIIKVGRVSGFLPVSQLIPEHYPRVEGGDKSKILERLTTYINQTFKVKVIDVDEKEEKLIVSEKAAWEEKQKDTLASYKIGDVVAGRVTGVVDFGAFIEFGDGLEGLVHISELAWQRIDDPRNIIKVGEKVKATVIGIEGSKISLSMKKLMKDPWREVVGRYKIGQVVRGKVLKINSFGVFVELDQNIHGLAHISELSERLVRDPSDIVKIGETYQFKILSIEPENHRLGLSLKALKSKVKKTEDELENKRTGQEKKTIKETKVPAEDKRKEKKEQSFENRFPKGNKPAPGDKEK